MILRNFLYKKFSLLLYFGNGRKLIKVRPKSSPSCLKSGTSICWSHSSSSVFSLPKNDHSRVKECRISISLNHTILAVSSLAFSHLKEQSLKLNQIFFWAIREGNSLIHAFLARLSNSKIPYSHPYIKAFLFSRMAVYIRVKLDVSLLFEYADEFLRVVNSRFVVTSRIDPPSIEVES